MTIKVMETEVIKAIDKILTDNNILHNVDNNIKTWGGDNYIGIFKNPKRILFAHCYIITITRSQLLHH